MPSDAQRRANRRYDAANMRRMSVGFSPADHDLHDWLVAEAARRGVSAPALVRRVLRERMEGGNAS